MRTGPLAGAALVAGQEFRVRLRTGRWRWLLAVWVAVVAAFTALLNLALVTTNTPPGVPLFGGLMLFVLGLVLMISPALTAQSVNGDRERGTLATLQVTLLSPAQIAVGKLIAGWAVGLTALALTLPFVGWAVVLGFALTVGTLIAFGLALPLTSETVQENDGSGGTYEVTVMHTERVWWLLAPNPFVVLADAAPTLPPRAEDDPREPFDPLGSIGQEVRRARRGSSGGRFDTRPVWPYGLGFNLLLGGGALWLTTRRLTTPSRTLARGVRVA